MLLNRLNVLFLVLVHSYKDIDKYLRIFNLLINSIIVGNTFGTRIVSTKSLKKNVFFFLLEKRLRYLIHFFKPGTIHPCLYLNMYNCFMPFAVFAALVRRPLSKTKLYIIIDHHSMSSWTSPITSMVALSPICLNDFRFFYIKTEKWVIPFCTPLKRFL
jgi:hypothetical protein